MAKRPIYHEDHTITIAPVTAGADLREAGIKAQESLYLAWDQEARRLFLVQWDRTRWVCSCGHRPCAHQLAANTYLFERVMNKIS